jgi:hypothetical protein
MIARRHTLGWLCSLAAMLTLRSRLAAGLRAALVTDLQALRLVHHRETRVIPPATAPLRMPLQASLHRLLPRARLWSRGSPFSLRSVHGGDADAQAECLREPAPPLSCWVRCVEGEPHLSVTIEIGGKESVLHRMQDDPLQTTLDRLQKLVKERFKQRSGGKKSAMDGARKAKKIKGKGKGRRRRAEADAAAAAAIAAQAAAVSSKEASSSEIVQPAENSATSDAGMAPETDVDARIWMSDGEGNEVSADSSNRDALIGRWSEKFC